MPGRPGGQGAATGWLRECAGFMHSIAASGARRQPVLTHCGGSPRLKCVTAVARPHAQCWLLEAPPASPRGRRPAGCYSPHWLYIMLAGVPTCSAAGQAASRLASAPAAAHRSGSGASVASSTSGGPPPAAAIRAAPPRCTASACARSRRQGSRQLIFHSTLAAAPVEDQHPYAFERD